MNRKLKYTFSLVSFILLWGLFGFVSTSSDGETVLQVTPVTMEATFVNLNETHAAEIPVTGEPEPVWTEILVFYSLIGITASFLILALLNFVNKSAVQHVENHETQSSNKTHRN